jgi:two-component system, chemotaxis family, chemotaxis protein CheY
MLRAAILDNSAIARGLLRTILTNGGYNVVSDGGLASANLSRLALLAPQLVFIALDTENDDPHSALNNLRGSLPKALIFAMSSGFTTEMINRGMQQGANGFIVKPFNGTMVLSSIRTSILKLAGQQKSGSNA